MRKITTLTTSQVAKYLGVSSVTVRSLIASGDLKAGRLGRRGLYRISVDSVKAVADAAIPR